MKIDLYTDVICPWCYLGQRRFALAVEAVPDAKIALRYLPFELSPLTPPAGKDRLKYLREKYGDGIQGQDERIAALGREIGLDFQFDQAALIPNTHDSHRVIGLAGQESPGLQAAVVEGLHRAYFTRGQDLGDRRVLVESAAAAGLNRARVEALLAGSEGSHEVRALEAEAARLGISGVPFFVFNDASAISGAQSVETFVSALREVAG